VVAEKRGLTALRYQHWEDGKGGEQVAFLFPLQLLFNEPADTRNRHFRYISTRLLRKRSAPSFAPKLTAAVSIGTVVFSNLVAEGTGDLKTKT
jgi:hypothetical protein